MEPASELVEGMRVRFSQDLMKKNGMSPSPKFPIKVDGIVKSVNVDTVVILWNNGLHKEYGALSIACLLSEVIPDEKYVLTQPICLGSMQLIEAGTPAFKVDKHKKGSPFLIEQHGIQISFEAKNFPGGYFDKIEI